MSKTINLFTKGTVKSGEREFTRLVGGFEHDKPTLTTKQIAELLNLDNRVVNQTLNRNIKSFRENVDIIDLKSAITESDSEFFDKIGYTKNAYNASKNVYLLSEAGFLLYLKFAEGDKAIEVYKDFIEDYFKTKAENAHMKIGIQEQIEKLKEKKASALGMSIMSQKDEDKIKYMNLVEEYNIQILDLEKMLSKEEVVKELQSKIHMSELIENAKGNYDVGVFSKVLDVKGMGRNNLFKWMREQKILDRNNVPYQQYMKYFKVIPVVSEKGFQSSKTLLQPKGVDYIVKRLIKGNKVVTKSVEEILGELEQAE